MVFVHFGGSRRLSAAFAPRVSAVVRATLQTGAAIHCGCATGADTQVIQAATVTNPQALHIFAQFAPLGAGAFSGSNVVAVLRAQAAGSQVSFLAGGPLTIPLRARLLRRSIAALKGCAFCVHFLAHPASAGSLATAAQAAALSIPVYVFPLGFPGKPQALRSLPGAWQPSTFAGFPCLQWAAGPSFF